MRRSDVLRLYNTKEAKEMRLALQQFIILAGRGLGVRRTPLFPTRFLEQNQNKRPRYVFPTSEAFS
ncbi:unnamed protein product, partial [marine sediment metagenome]